MKRYVAKFLRDEGITLRAGVSADDRRHLDIMAYASWRRSIKVRPSYRAFLRSVPGRYPQRQQSNQTRASRARHRMRVS